MKVEKPPPYDFTPEQMEIARKLLGEIEMADGKHWMMDALGWTEDSRRQAVLVLRAAYAELKQRASEPR